MKIAAAQVIPYSLPFREPYTTARGTLQRREMLLLRVRSEDGLEGLGEAVPLSLRGGADVGTVAGELRTWTQNTEASAAHLSEPARCAVETALLDLASRMAQVPLWSHLKAERAEPVRCNATLPAGEPALVAKQAEGWAGDGFDTFKLKVGVPKDSEQVAAVRRAVGPAAKLRVDANGSWGPAEAVTKLNRMAGEGLELAEQPCGTLEEMGQVRARCEVRLAADESVTTAQAAVRASELGACELVTAKLSKVGGIGALRGIAAVLPTYLSSALDGPVGIAAAAHAAQILGEGDAGIAHGLATQRLFAETIASRGCELRHGFLHLPEGPGLGVEIDDAALERHRL